MTFIEEKYFLDQLKDLSKKYPKIFDDLKDFKRNFKFEPFSDLGNQIYKFRIKNSSIPVGKRGGFRVILKYFSGKVVFLNIYSKTDKENISKDEIIYSLKKILE